MSVLIDRQCAYCRETELAHQVDGCCLVDGCCCSGFEPSQWHDAPSDPYWEWSDKRLMAHIHEVGKEAASEAVTT